MNFRTKISIGAAALMGGLSAVQADSLLYGWDFSQFSGSGFPLVGSDLVTSIDSNYTDVTGFSSSTLDFSNFGTPSFGSNAAYGSMGTSSINTAINTDRRTDPGDTLFGINFDTTTDANALGFARTSSTDISGLTFSMTLDTRLSDGITVSYAGKAVGNPSSIEWWYDNGSGLTQIGDIDNLTSSFAAYSVTLPDAAEGIEDLQLVGQIGSGAVVGDELTIDNIQVVATTTSIPEPSTYAALFGILGLGWIIIRRRR